MKGENFWKLIGSPNAMFEACKLDKYTNEHRKDYLHDVKSLKKAGDDEFSQLCEKIKNKPALEKQSKAPQSTDDESEDDQKTDTSGATPATDSEPEPIHPDPNHEQNGHDNLDDHHTAKPLREHRDDDHDGAQSDNDNPFCDAQQALGKCSHEEVQQTHSAPSSPSTRDSKRARHGEK